MFNLRATLDLFLNILSYSLETALFILIFKQIRRKLTSFAIYIWVLVPLDFYYLWLEHTPRYGKPFWIYFWWISQFVFSLLRLFVISEICWRALHVYPAIWSFMWRILAIVSSVLLIWTIRVAMQDVHRFPTFVTGWFQRFELMEAVLLLIVLAAGAYYHIIVPPLYRWILAGIGIYSAIQVANYNLGLLTNYPPLSVFDFIKRVSFVVASAIWAWGIWRWADVPSQRPVLISQQTYDDLSPQVRDRLRDLNDRLADLLRRGK